VRRQPVDPLAGRDRLSGRGIGAHGGPEAFLLQALVGDRALDDEDELIELAGDGAAERRQERLAVGIGEHGVVQAHRRQPRERPEQHVLEARLRGRRHGDRVAVAAEPRVIQRMSISAISRSPSHRR